MMSLLESVLVVIFAGNLNRRLTINTISSADLYSRYMDDANILCNSEGLPRNNYVRPALQIRLPSLRSSCKMTDC